MGVRVRERRRRFVRPDVIALIYVSLGDREAAFRWLDSAYEARPYPLIRLTTNRRWDPIRADPRFAALVKRIGLRPVTPASTP